MIADKIVFLMFIAQFEAQRHTVKGTTVAVGRHSLNWLALGDTF